MTWYTSLYAPAPIVKQRSVSKQIGETSMVDSDDNANIGYFTNLFSCVRESLACRTVRSVANFKNRLAAPDSFGFFTAGALLL